MTALEATTPESAITALKTSIARSLSLADGTAIVHTTDYFNHTIVPDMVLTWQHDRRERKVFLRGQGHSEDLDEDLRYMERSTPLIVALGGDNHRWTASESTATLHLQESASEREVLVTDQHAIDDLGSKARSRGVVSLFSQALIQGGRGLLDAGAVEQTTKATAAGFDGAQQLDAVATRGAVEAADRFLAKSYANRLTRVLSAVWKGHGGSESHFPASDIPLGSLSDPELNFLITSVASAEPGFWSGVAQDVTLGQLGRLAPGEANPNLQALVQQIAWRLASKAVRIKTHPPRMDEPADIPWWFVDQGCLALRGDSWSAYFAENRLEELPNADSRDGLEVAELRERLARTGLTLADVSTQRGDRVYSVTAVSGPNMTDEELRRFEQDMRLSGAMVQRATASGAGLRRVSCDFTTRTASGPTSAVFDVRTLTVGALRLLIDVEDEVWERIRTLVGEVPAPITRMETLAEDLFSHFEVESEDT